MTLTLERKQEMIDNIRRLPERLEALVGSLTEEELTTPYLEGEWTVAQNVHHLADSHMHSLIRMKLALAEEHPTIKAYDQEVWAEMVDARTAAINTSLNILKGLHARWAALFETLSEEQYARTLDHPENGTMSVYDILDYYGQHGEAHLDQIRRTLAAGKK